MNKPLHNRSNRRSQNRVMKPHATRRSDASHNPALSDRRGATHATRHRSPCEAEKRRGAFVAAATGTGRPKPYAPRASSRIPQSAFKTEARRPCAVRALHASRRAAYANMQCKTSCAVRMPRIEASDDACWKRDAPARLPRWVERARRRLSPRPTMGEVWRSRPLTVQDRPSV